MYSASNAFLFYIPWGFWEEVAVPVRGRKRKIRDRPVEKEARIMSGSARKKMPPVMILERGA